MPQTQTATLNLSPIASGSDMVFEVFLPALGPGSGVTTILRQFGDGRVQTILLSRGREVCSYIRYLSIDALERARQLEAAVLLKYQT